MAQEHFSPNHKRVKFEQSEESSGGDGPLTVRANARIHLCLHDLLLKRPFHTFPTYTHQLFENEEIVVQSEQEKKNLKIEVHLDTRTFRQAVNITGVDAESDTFAQIVTAMKKGVAPDATFHQEHHFRFLSMQSETVDEKELLTPPGELFHAFVLKEDGDDREEYECYRCGSDNLSSAKVLARAEKMAMWFIETADAVDFLHNPQWEVLFLYQKGHAIIQPKHVFNEDGSVKVSKFDVQPGAPTRSLIGHTTLFTFHSPAGPDRLRICQELVLPYKQAQGLGRELMLNVYNIAAQRAAVAEVTVESPCLGFQRLRDTVDFEWALKCAQREGERAGEGQGEGAEDWAALEDEELARRLKIVPSQAVFIKEAKEYLDLVLTLKHRLLRKGHAGEEKTSLQRENSIESEEVEEEAKQALSLASPSQEGEGEEEEALSLHNAQHWTDLERLKFLHEQVESHEDFAAFRVKVKRHLLREDKELKYLEKKAMQHALKALFAERMVRYHHVLRALNRQKLLDADLLSDETLAAFF